MALSSQQGVPHKGWHEVNVIDLHEDEGLAYGDYQDCEFCGHEQIRFVHLLEHVSYDHAIRVGCICACNLTNDYKNPKKRERQLKSRANRKAKFPNRKWKATKHGGETIVLDGYRVTVAKISIGCFRLWINSKKGTKTYPDARTAKLRAFDAVQKMMERGIK
jgi:hypothetical protein